MRTSRNILLIVTAGIFSSCGSSTPTFTALKKPVSISRSSEQILFQNELTEFAYVADEFTQSLTVVDTNREELVDTAHDDDFDFSPMAVGGEPSAVIVDDSVNPHRIFVADKFNNRILAYQMGDIDSDIVHYTPISLGGTSVGVSSRAMFKNEGAASSPALTNLTVDPAKAQNQSWFLKFNDGKYEVTGTVSGLQTNLVTEGKPYTSDDGEISFFISGGGEKTTDDDKFYFSTAVVKPHDVAGSPVDLLIHDGKMYILTTAPSVIIYDLDTLTEDSTVLFPDPAVPTKMALLGDKIYISNLASSTFYEFDITTPAITGIPTGLDGTIQSIGASGDRVFLVRSGSNTTSIWNLTSATVEKTFSFDHAGSSFFTATVGSLTLGLIPNTSGDVDVINAASPAKIDTDLNDKTVFTGQEFFDVLPESNPELISVNTESSITLSEFWQMIFEGVIPNMADLSGTFATDTVTAAGVDFTAAGVQVGDLVVVPAKNAEFEIESIDSATSLTLSTTPGFSGTQTFEIRSNGTYIVIGSISGVQENRVTPGVTYTSDDDQISLKTGPSFDKPETRGDFFSFQTINDIDPIVIGSQAVASQGIFFERISDNLPVAYVLEQTTGQIVIVDLTNYDVKKTL